MHVLSMFLCWLEIVFLRNEFKRFDREIEVWGLKLKIRWSFKSQICTMKYVSIIIVEILDAFFQKLNNIYSY